MASATGIPEWREPEAGRDQQEMEPLLGRPGDAAQQPGAMMIKNLGIGTGILAEIGIVLLVALVWANVFLNKLILFSGHPLAQSLAVFVLVQSVLVLQPTHTAEQKSLGRKVHGSLNLVAFLLLVTGVTIVEYNKFSYNGPHFHSAHGVMGVVTCCLLLLQYFVGFTMWLTPGLYGGEERAKSIWKYHRWSGYTILLFMLATVATATLTDYNKAVLRIRLWAVAVSAIVIAIGIFPRVQKQKLGLRGSPPVPNHIGTQT